MHDALKTIGTAIKKLEADGTQQGLDSVQMSRKMIEFGAQFITKYPGLASQLTGRIGELFYTPNVCKIFKDNAAEVREKIPKAARPLTFEFNQKDANDYLKKGKEKKQAIRKIQQEILDKAEKMFNFYAPGQKWTPEMIQYLTTVITDGGRILGLGDQGLDGQMITFGKASCNTVGTKNGIPREFLLGIGIDVGTSEEKRKDPTYKGLQKTRNVDISEKDADAYTHLILEALDGLKTRLIQFEDFEGVKAYEHLYWAKEHLKTAVFNDDSEGAGAVVATAIKGLESKNVDINKSIILAAGAGGMNSGLAHHLRILYPGIEKNWYFLDKDGLLTENREKIHRHHEDIGMVLKDPAKIEKITKYLKKHNKTIDDCKLDDLFECFKDSLGERGAIIIIGASSAPALISKDLIIKASNYAMGKTPGAQLGAAVFALSNPPDQGELVETAAMAADFEISGKSGGVTSADYLKKFIDDVMKATFNHTHFIGGTRLPTVEGADYVTDQANNVSLFPGLTLASFLGNFTKITDGMWKAGIEALLQYHKDKTKDKRHIFPSTDNLHGLTEFLAEKILLQAIKEGVSKTFDQSELGGFPDFFINLLHYTRGERSQVPREQLPVLKKVCGAFSESRMPAQGEIEELEAKLMKI